MKKTIFFLLLSVGAVAGCTWQTQDAVAVWNNTEGPVVTQEGQIQDGVRLLARKPAGNCTFKGGILGDSNPAEAGLPSSIIDINSRIRAGLVSSAHNMGGNTVWLRTTDWQNPEVSADYYQPFLVNNVEYSALVYSCPAE
uniref:DUF4156 domain-containing protein n=1 Tax=uncultured Elusimicrobia bacterium TaxID=699876 RepID=A0A650EPP7_9BACT|nr:hypothetical protein Elusimicrob2101_1470 [uncultured Elusimicrobia bacterium]